MDEFDEQRLRELDEALRASAVHAGYTFVDEGPLEGLIPETPIRSIGGPLLDLELDELPDDFRFAAWADFRVDGDVVEVWAGEVHIGDWLRTELSEVLTRYRRAAGG